MLKSAVQKIAVFERTLSTTEPARSEEGSSSDMVDERLRFRGMWMRKFEERKV